MNHVFHIFNSGFKSVVSVSSQKYFVTLISHQGNKLDCY